MTRASSAKEQYAEVPNAARFRFLLSQGEGTCCSSTRIVKNLQSILREMVP
ncbi:hypothetical protein RchiOBHm_Chr7g0231941 [Rosa chinensis]|uniref:Uncharacterized protein n=1 Tax=Rosa chinensis TaxID=74649 RepID=A0A2P6PFT8_ROSCH|nr:hypothetical protein RchiOBHm_Chr7g0231941 [Rosa chinensis]